MISSKAWLENLAKLELEHRRSSSNLSLLFSTNEHRLAVNEVSPSPTTPQEICPVSLVKGSLSRIDHFEGDPKPERIMGSH